MTEKLNVRQATRESNLTFCQFSLRICLPYLLLQLATYAMSERFQFAAHKGHLPLLYSILLLMKGLATIWLYCTVEVLVSAMSLRVREGHNPSFKLVKETLRYRGFAALVWKLMASYAMWTILAAVCSTVVAMVLLRVMGAGSLTHSGMASTSGIGAVAGGVPHDIMLVLFGAIMAWPLSLYLFVMQMFAITRAAGDSFFHSCVMLTKKVWKTAFLVAITMFAIQYGLVGLDTLAWRHFTPPYPVRVATDLVVLVLFYGGISAWFILLRTNLAVQLMESASAIPLFPQSRIKGAVKDGLAP